MSRWRGDRRRLAQITAWIVLTILLVLFAVLNLNTVKVDWIFGSGKAPLILVIIVAFLVGVAFALLARRFAGRRQVRHPAADRPQRG